MTIRWKFPVHMKIVVEDKILEHYVFLGYVVRYERDIKIKN